MELRIVYIVGPYNVEALQELNSLMLISMIIFFKCWTFVQMWSVMILGFAGVLAACGYHPLLGRFLARLNSLIPSLLFSTWLIWWRRANKWYQRLPILSTWENFNFTVYPENKINLQELQIIQMIIDTWHLVIKYIFRNSFWTFITYCNTI